MLLSYTAVKLGLWPLGKTEDGVSEESIEENIWILESRSKRAWRNLQKDELYNCIFI
jgi:hypothetical protein